MLTIKNLQDRVNSPPAKTLTAFFDLCRTNNFAKTLLYHEVPQYYTWEKYKFARRKRGQEVAGFPGIRKDAALGRVYNVHPTQIECYYLRMLLFLVRWPTAFETLRTINGVICATYQGACKELGLLEGDEHWENTLSETVISESAAKLRLLFVVILIFCQPSDPIDLWNKFRNDLCEDILNRLRKDNHDTNLQYTDEVYSEEIIMIEDNLQEICEKSLADFGLKPSKRNNPNNIDPFEETFRRPYDLN